MVHPQLALVSIISNLDDVLVVTTRKPPHPRPIEDQPTVNPHRVVAQLLEPSFSLTISIISEELVLDRGMNITLT